MAVQVEEEFKVIRGVTTNILKCGKLTDEQLLVLIIPGNPGIPDYYVEFMVQLHTLSQALFPVWCVAHAGHVLPQADLKQKSDNNNIYDIYGQINHKLDFINSEVPERVKLILIGHSIGCFITLHMVPQMPNRQVLKCIMLFPVIEKMALSPNGRIVAPLLRYFGWMAPYPIYPVQHLIPKSVKEKLIKWYFGDKNIPQCAVDATLKLANPSSIQSMINWGKSNMFENVVEANHDIISANIAKCMFYYGKDDDWVPIQCYHDLKEKYPNADILLCEHGIHHAFVLEFSAEMARILWKWLSQNIRDIAR